MDHGQNTRIYQIITVFAAFVINMVAHGMVYSFGVLFIGLEETFNKGKADIAWIGSIAASLLYLNGPLTGYLTARYGCRYVVVAGSLVGCLGYGASMFVSNLYILYITMGIVAGSGFGFLYLPAMVAVTRAFNKYRTLATGLALCGAGVGAFVFSPVQKFLLDKYSWQGTLLINAGIILNCGPFGLMLRGNQPETTKARDTIDLKADNNKQTVKEVEVKLLNDLEPAERNEYSANDRASHGRGEGSQDMEIVIEAGEVASSKKTSIWDNLDILKEPVFLLFTISQFLFFFGLYLPFIYIPDRAKRLGIDENSAVWVVSTIGIASIFSRVVGGYAVDRLSIDRAKIISFTLLIGGIITALGPLFTSLWSLFIYAAIWGICIGVSISFITVVLADLLGVERINEAFGMNNLFTGISVLLGPPFAGLLFDMTGDYNATFIVAGVSQALAGVLMLFTPMLKKYK